MEHHVINILSNFGFGGLIFIIWYWDRKQINKMMEMQKKTLKELEAQITINREYCSSFKEILSEFKEVAFMEMQQLARIEQKMDNNQFCPIIREFRREVNEERKTDVKR